MNTKQFSIDDIQYVATEDSVEFAIAKIAILSTKPNSHKINITKEILKRDGTSVLGKWILADYDGTDTTTHTRQEKIVGVIPKDSKLEFVENDDGTTTMFAEAVISKIYATEVYNLFKEYNFRNVSVEMSTFDDTLNNDDTIDISGFCIYGVTILGMSVGGSCPDANMSIIRFSKDKADEYYHNIIKKYNETQEVSHPINKSKEAVDMGSWDGDKAKDDLLKEKNFDTLAKSVCLLLEDGWEDRIKGSLKYPVMNLKNGTWVYNAQGLSSAKAYGEQHDPSIADKVISIQKNLGLYKDNANKEESMKDKELDVNFSEVKDKEDEKDVIMEKEEEKKELAKEDTKEEDKKEDEKVMGCDEKEMSDDSDDEDEKLKEEKDEEDDIKDEEKKMEKKFSLDAYVDASAIMVMLENETEEYRELANKVMKEFSANEIVSKIIEMAKENFELKSEKEKNDIEKRDKKFAIIMASVKEDLDDETYSKLSEEGKNLSIDQLGAFENKVKAFAYEATKQKKDEKVEDSEIMKFGSNDQNLETDEDVFSRLSKI